MSSKRKLKIKKRRSITREELFKKKSFLQYLRMKLSIEAAFPDPEERMKYIDALIEKLESLEEIGNELV